MPTYDYRCTACGELFEVTHPMGSTEPRTCPVCNAPAKRVFSPVGVAFKGSGFHNTDYRPAPKPEAPSCPSSDSGSPACTNCPSSS